VLQEDFLDINVETTMIHYGLPKDLYSFQPEHDGYAVWIGKMEGGKAPKLAIELALAAGIKIVLMGPPYNTGCFWEQVAPYLDNPNVFWVRGVDDAQKYKIMSRAKVFIYSNDNTWKEHFGIVLAEALAMGVPVVGFNRINQDCAIVVDGIIHHGRHGYILHYKDSNDTKEILDKGVPYVQSIDRIDRKECREHFEKRFTAELMAKRYEWFYENIMNGMRFGRGEPPI
jgi:glycosyltransferase involved in cell wall biosynthesis